MASGLAHLAFGLLYFIFPNSFDFSALIIGVMISDAEYIFIILKDFLKGIEIEKLSLDAFNTSFLHSLIGVYFFLFPLSYFALSKIYISQGIAFSAAKVVFSLLFGMTTHLIIDLPAHTSIMLFYPFKVIKNPFLIDLKWGFLKKIYPYRKVEYKPYTYLKQFNYLVLTTLLGALFFVLFLLF